MAYTTAIIRRTDRNSDGRVAIFVEYTGDAQEPLLLEPTFIDASDPSPLIAVRKVAKARVLSLNSNATLKTQADALVGSALDLVTPFPPDPASTFGQFMAASAPFTPGTTPQDVFTITGSATKLVVVQRMALMTVQTTAGVNAWALLKRSTANTGGTSAAVTMVPSDSAYPAATASVRQYTVNATAAGNLLGNLWTGRVASPAPATAPAGDLERAVFADTRTGVPLRGVTESLSWNFAGAALPAGLSVQASVWWTEN